MKQLQGVVVGLALSMIAGVSSGAHEQSPLIAGVEGACSTRATRSGVGSVVTGAEQPVSHSQPVQDLGQGRLREYLSLHAEFRHQSGLAEGMAWPGPRAN